VRTRWTVKLDGRVIDVDERERGRSGQTVLSAVTTFDVEVNGERHPVEVLVEFDPPPVIP
jgi:hypothetical protein